MTTTLPAEGQKTLAERLGYAPTDRLLIIHADDAGMCHSANVATMRALEAGTVTCASVMVPCPWFPEMARYSRDHPEADLGVHLTLTSEWQYYRWGPVAPISAVPSLLDAEGYFPRGTAEAVERATPAEVEQEIRSQIVRARAFGIDPTHVDSHMGTLFRAPLYEVYTRAAREMGVMPMLLAPTPQRIEQARQAGIDALATYEALRQQGFLFLDTLNTGARGDPLEARRENYYAALRNLPPGVTEIIVHLSLDDEEIRAVTSAWAQRWHEYQIFTDPQTRALIDSLGIKLIGYKDLRQLFGRNAS
jgi:hypothetical protein